MVPQNSTASSHFEFSWSGTDFLIEITTSRYFLDIFVSFYKELAIVYCKFVRVGQLQL